MALRTLAAGGLALTIGAALPAAPALASGGDVKWCIDDYGDSTAAGNPVVLWTCNGTAAERWSQVDGTLRINGECFETLNQGEADGTPVELGACDGRAAQQWTDRNGELVAAVSGKCLDDPGDSAANGTRLVIWDCDGSVGQNWARSAVAAAPIQEKNAPNTPWLPAALVALAAAAAALVLGVPGSGRKTAGIARGLRARLPQRRRRTDPAVQALLADPATVDSAVLAFAAAGSGSSWWPYAVAVSAEDATVWLAGFDVPEPTGSWRAVPGDPRAWTVPREELSVGPADLDAPETCLVLLGLLDDAAIVLDVAKSHGALGIGGDPRRAGEVRSAIAGQIEGGEVVLREESARLVGGRPHWAVDVDAEGWISVHGRRVEFAQAPEPSDDSESALTIMLSPNAESAPFAALSPSTVAPLTAVPSTVAPSTAVPFTAVPAEVRSEPASPGIVAVSSVLGPQSADPALFGSADTGPGQPAAETALSTDPGTQSWDNTAVSSRPPEPTAQG
jgi:hypothetical protein